MVLNELRHVVCKISLSNEMWGKGNHILMTPFFTFSIVTSLYRLQV